MLICKVVILFIGGPIAEGKAYRQIGCIFIRLNNWQPCICSICYHDLIFFTKLKYYFVMIVHHPLWMIILLFDIAMWDKEETNKSWHIECHGLKSKGISVIIHYIHLKNNFLNSFSWSWNPFEIRTGLQLHNRTVHKILFETINAIAASCVDYQANYFCTGKKKTWW